MFANCWIAQAGEHFICDSIWPWWLPGFELLDSWLPVVELEWPGIYNIRLWTMTRVHPKLLGICSYCPSQNDGTIPSSFGWILSWFRAWCCISREDSEAVLRHSACIIWCPQTDCQIWVNSLGLDPWWRSFLFFQGRSYDQELSAG